MDLKMPGLTGVEATRRIASSVAVLVLTMFDDDSVFAAMRAGARGYLLKDATLDDLARAITAVHRGEAIFSRPWRPGCTGTSRPTRPARPPSLT